MIEYTTANNKTDLEGILALQKVNLTAGLTADEVKKEGFVTVDHTYEQLKKLNDNEKHVIAKDGDKVIGYTLAMTKSSKFELPVLFPMFNMFDHIIYGDKKINDYNYLVVGQVCVDKTYRGQGVFDNCYMAYRKYYGQKYDFAITEIADANIRSLKAHYRVGFKEIHTYTGPDSTEWVIVLWDWK